MDQEVTRVKVVSSGASTPVPAVRGDVTRMSLSSNRSEFWDKEAMVPLKGGHVGNNLDSETNVTLSGASNVSGNNSTNNKVEANGEAIKDKDDSGLVAIKVKREELNQMRPQMPVTVLGLAFWTQRPLASENQEVKEF